MHHKKKENEQYHFLKRMEQRFQEISLEDYHFMRKQVRDGNSKIIKKQSLRVSIHGVLYKDFWYVVAYDRNTKELITVMPKTDRRCVKLNKKGAK
jgi:hypothetical protein